MQARHFIVAFTACVSFVAAFAATIAAAAPWRVEPGLISQESNTRLTERYADIRSAAELEALLTDIGRRHLTLRLEAHMVAGTWVVSGERAMLVTEIDVETTTRLTRQPLNAQVQNYVGQVDSDEARAKVKDVAAKYMRRRGYPKSRADLRVQKADSATEGMAYTLKVAEGEPCILDQIGRAHV